MTYRKLDLASWAIEAEKYLLKHGYTQPEKTCPVRELATACQFPSGQWYRVRQAMLDSGIPIAVQPGRGGGMYLGEQGCQASHMVLSGKYVESRLNTSGKQEDALKPIGWDNILRFAREQLKYDLGIGAKRISSKAQQLALPEPVKSVDDNQPFTSAEAA